jgi:hypothetical protein
MSREVQINANRENAKHSTGPRTVDGKIKAVETPPVTDSVSPRMHVRRKTRNISTNFWIATWRANILLTGRLDINDTEDDSKRVYLVLRYFNTSDRAFNRNLNDLRKLQKESKNNEIGFVRQITLPPLVNRPAKPKTKDENRMHSAQEAHALSCGAGCLLGWLLVGPAAQQPYAEPQTAMLILLGIDSRRQTT